MREILQIDQIITILSNGKIDVAGRFLWGSNYTFLVEVKSDEETISAVYKPSRGERPLWDFPQETLAARRGCRATRAVPGEPDLTQPNCPGCAGAENQSRWGPQGSSGATGSIAAGKPCRPDGAAGRPWRAGSAAAGLPEHRRG